MTKQKVHNFLYIVAFFAVIALLVALHNGYIYRDIFWVGSALIEQLFYIAYLVLLIVNPYLKINLFLFLVVFYIPTTVSISIVPLYKLIFTSHFMLLNVGHMPGIANPLSMLLVNGSVFVLLVMRLFGYWQERNTGSDHVGF